MGRLDQTGSPALRLPSKPTLPRFAEAAQSVLCGIDLQRKTHAHELGSLLPELIAKKIGKFRMHVTRINKCVD